MNKTGIQYLDFTWNPTHGCTPISDGCRLCWAARTAKRLAGMGVGGYDKAEPFRVTYHPDRLVEPLKLRKPARIGVSFMGDLFHEYVHDGFIRRVIEITAETAQHQYLILTKRPTRMRKYFHEYGFEGHGENLELGVTVERNLGIHDGDYDRKFVFRKVRDLVVDEPLRNVVLDRCRGVTWQHLRECVVSTEESK